MSEILDTQTVSAGNGQQKALPNATATLVLGILSIVICFLGFILGIIGMVLHKKDKELYLSNPAMYEQSYKAARAGFICSLIGTILSVLVILFYVVYFIFIISVISGAAAYSN